MVWIAVYLAVIGLCAGSFINAWVWRLHQQSKIKSPKSKNNLSIVKGRSVCPSCRHQLAWYDLIPLISWLVLKARCRYCKKPISYQYPIVEALTSLIFAFSYVFWPQTVHLNGQWLLLITWLAASVGLIALAVYDLRWMLLPNRILYPILVLAVAGRLAYITAFERQIFHAILLWVSSLAIASGVFLVLFAY
jgi:prepilin signal peptidase PulO-like enzyme (type II secretory pathway)